MNGIDIAAFIRVFLILLPVIAAITLALMYIVGFIAYRIFKSVRKLWPDTIHSQKDNTGNNNLNENIDL